MLALNLRQKKNTDILPLDFKKDNCENRSTDDSYLFLLKIMILHIGGFSWQAMARW